jgi:hypothetical protein
MLYSYRKEKKRNRGHIEAPPSLTDTLNKRQYRKGVSKWIIKENRIKPIRKSRGQIT